MGFKVIGSTFATVICFARTINLLLSHFQLQTHMGRTEGHSLLRKCNLLLNSLTVHSLGRTKSGVVAIPAQQGCFSSGETVLVILGNPLHLEEN